MTTDREFERVAAEWLDTGTDSTPPGVIDTVLLAVRTTPQERDLRVPWRTLSMKHPLYAAAVIAVLAVAGIAAIYAFGPGSNVGIGPTQSPTPDETQAASPTAAPNSSPTFNEDGSLNTTGWTAFVSDRYRSWPSDLEGYSISHPADWTVRPAERDWDFETDAADWLSPATDDFISPDGHVRVSAWAIPLDFDEPMGVESQSESWANVAAWVEDYCQAARESPCTGIAERAVPLCLEVRDCHPGLLVPFEEDVLAFFTGGGVDDNMIVVAVWRGESDPAVAPYGGSQRLLEAFLSTMCVWPEDARPQLGGC